MINIGDNIKVLTCEDEDQAPKVGEIRTVVGKIQSEFSFLTVGEGGWNLDEDDPVYTTANLLGYRGWYFDMSQEGIDWELV